MADNAKDEMAATPHKITLKDKSGVTQTWMVSDKILRDMNATKRYAEATGAKPDYSSVLRLGVRMGEVILASRPGAPDTFAVEDRFYFGKGRKERFEKEYVLWGLPKGETDRLHEKVLYTQAKTPAQMEAAKRRAAADGWHSFRVQILDLSKPFRWPV